MTVYFISDLHLDKFEDPQTKLFFNFLDTVAIRSEAVYILGDLFNYWIGDDQTSKVITLVKEKINKLHSLGIKFYFMPGNRDFLLGKNFAQAANITILRDPTVVSIYNKSILLSHGDTLCLDDKSYLCYRAIVQTLFVKKLFLMLPFKIRNFIAKILRKKSQKRYQKEQRSYDIDENASIKLMEKFSTKILIHGHTHKPNIHYLNQDLTRIVLGDWHDSAKIYAVAPNAANLVTIRNN